MSAPAMNSLWSPRGVALIGASPTPNSLGARLMHYLSEHGYGGAIHPVNPRYEEISGLKCWPDVSSIDGPVDLALVLVAAERVKDALKDCAAKGVPHAIVYASGFGETGEDGRGLEQGMVAFARANGMRIVGPNCIGMVSTAQKLVAGFSPLFSRLRFEPGGVALVTQSGALGYGIVSLAAERGVRFSRIVNTGNEADLTTADFLRDLIEDEATTTILVYSEGVRNPMDWRVLGVQAAARGKPVIVLKSGRSDAGGRAAASHTAALAGDDALWDAALRDLGLLRADDVDDLLDLVAMFEHRRKPAGPGVGVLTTSGGAGILAADGLSAAGLEIPALAGDTVRALQPVFPAFGTIANPLDLTGAMLTDPALFRAALRAMAADPAMDALMVCFCVLQGAEVERAVDDLLAVMAETSKPIVVSRTGAEFLAPGVAARLQQAGVPVFVTPARAARALRMLHGFSHPDRQPIPVLPPAGAAPAGWPASGQALTERETKRLLGVEGLPVTREVLATSADEAARIAEDIGYPVVLKIDSPDIPHKTEAGGLRLNLRDAAAVRAAYDEIVGSVTTYKPGAQRNGCLVQEQITGAVAELLVGVTSSPLGPMVTVGLGGIFVEVFGDVSRRLAPVNAAGARAMLQGLRGWRLLDGARGMPPADVEALADVIVRVSQLALSWPGDWELDLNPVLALPVGQGCRIADALLLAH